VPDICEALVVGAPPEAVFDAINSAEGNRAFWTDQTEYEPAEGSVAVFSFGPNAETQFRFEVTSLYALDEYVRTGASTPPFSVY